MDQRHILETRSVYVDGVAAIGALTADFDETAWSTPNTCGHWDAAATARHLLGVIGWYHDWLDRAVAGDAQAPFPLEDLPARNAAALADLGDLDPARAVADFSTEATRYLDRLDEVGWDLPFGYPGGTVTAGLHAGIAAVEWHVHAWDLSGVGGGRRHEPADPTALFRRAGACQAALASPPVRLALGLIIPLAARRRPWATLLGRLERRTD